MTTPAHPTHETAQESARTKAAHTEAGHTEPATPSPAPEPIAGAALGGLAVRRHGDAASDPLGGSAASPDVVDVLRRQRGRGRALPGDVATKYGEALDADLSGVRVHTGGEADTLARSVQATAFTHGSDLFFTQGSFDPGSTSGQHLLAHELSHVVQHQQGLDRGTGATTIGRADDPLERAADESASRVVGALRRTTSGAESHQHGPGCGHGAEAPGATLHRFIATGATLRRGRRKGGAINTDKVGPRIAQGHAYQKHVVEEQQFTDLAIDSPGAFAEHIDKVIWEASDNRALKDGRQAFWHAPSGTVVIYNPNAVDDGTCFRPDTGKRYFNNLK